MPTVSSRRSGWRPRCPIGQIVNGSGNIFQSPLQCHPPPAPTEPGVDVFIIALLLCQRQHIVFVYKMSKYVGMIGGKPSRSCQFGEKPPGSVGTIWVSLLNQTVLSAVASCWKVNWKPKHRVRSRRNERIRSHSFLLHSFLTDGFS